MKKKKKRMALFKLKNKPRRQSDTSQIPAHSYFPISDPCSLSHSNTYQWISTKTGLEALWRTLGLG